MTTPVAKATIEENSAGGSRLARVLTRLAEPGQGLPSVVDGGANEILAVLLREIEETVMPRRLSLFDGANELIRLVISNRRLVSTPAPAPPPRSTSRSPTRPASATTRSSARPRRRIPSSPIRARPTSTA